MRVKFCLLWLLALGPWLIQRCSSSEILMITLAATKSHKVPFWELAKGLIARNHSAVFISPFPREFELPGLTEMAPAGLVNYNREFNTRDLMGARLSGAQPYSVPEMIGYPIHMCSYMLESKQMQKLLKSGKKFDLLVIDSSFPDCGMGLVYFYKIPFVYINTVPFYIYPISYSGSPAPYAVSNFFLRPYNIDMNLLERMINAVYYLISDAVHLITTKMYMQSLLRKHFGSEMPNVRAIRKNVSLILQNGHPAVTNPRPYLPNVVEIACIHCRPAKPLNKNFEGFINKGGDKGFIVVSMGGCVRSSGMPDGLLKMILKAFSQMPQQIIWKWEDDSRVTSDMPKNVMLSRWLPQQDLLGHPKARAFITHCGIQSLLETVYHGVPAISMPMFADQEANAAKAQHDGYALGQDAYDLTSESLLHAMTEVVNNPKYRKEVKNRQMQLRDQKESPVERAVYWTEYIIRHDGADHLKSPSRNMNVIQYYSLDVFFFLSIAAILLVWLIKFYIGCFYTPKKTTPKKTKDN